MKQIEVTVKVKNTLEEIDELLTSKGFKLIRKSRVEDEYVCPNDIKVNRENILKVLSSSVLIRYLKTQDGEFKKCLPENTIYVNNSSSDLKEKINKIYQNIKNIQNNDW